MPAKQSAERSNANHAVTPGPAALRIQTFLIQPFAGIARLLGFFLVKDRGQPRGFWFLLRRLDPRIGRGDRGLFGLRFLECQRIAYTGEKLFRAGGHLVQQGGLRLVLRERGFFRVALAVGR